MSYQKIIEHYKNLPEDKKQFIYGEYVSKGQCCAIGALKPRLFSELIPEENNNKFDGLVLNDPEFFEILKKDFDVTFEELCLLQDVNDFCGESNSEAPEERFKRVLSFLEEKEKSA